MSEAERRAAADDWLSQRISRGLISPMGVALAALGQGYAIKPAKRRYRPRGTWKKLRRCKCRCNG